ncbi:hypothetical protein KFL_004630080 [Klebsormidium nitens]|uniref:Pentatricopeptide repeat domain containing protein n=1 Tax=Klebsormidium nitens TaxID=105231 RepID=A0A1Y1IID3_KLENI|nr:hypothetical protein KFL_004630080 [Klebsormidium nitens]|eukprot:GAQ88841.1 hypothetical protein KFL_004630080 [Klebsormidium nitens]
MLEAEANGTGALHALGNCHQPFSWGVARFSYLVLPACAKSAIRFVRSPGDISGGHSRTFGASAIAAAEKEDAEDLKEQGAEKLRRASGQNNEDNSLWRPSEWREEKVLRGELLRSLREWPPDADLDERLPNGTIGGRPFGVRSLASALYQLSDPLENSRRDKSAKQRVNLGETTYRCSTEDAQRALNVLDWWLSKQPQDSSNSVDMLFSPVLQALRAARYTDAISRLWDRYRSRAERNKRLIPIFLAACLRANMFEQVLKMYEEVQANGWSTSSNSANLVIKAMHAQGRSRDEVWALYKSLVEKTGLTIEWPTVGALLTSGITVEEFLSLKYRYPLDQKKKLVRALVELGRANEAREIVREMLDLQERAPPLPIVSFISLLRVLIDSGLQAEAQMLADQQERLGVQLDGALRFFLRTVKEPETALTAYKALEAIKGSHHDSLAVQALLIKRCYSNRRLTKAMYQAYLVGKGLEADFYAVDFANVIERLAEKNWAAEAEGVLADYFAVRRKRQEPHVLPERAFQELASMYLRAHQPEKLVGLVKDMVKQAYFVSNGLIVSWWNKLKAGDHAAEAEELLVAQKKMSQMRQDGEAERGRREKDPRGHLTKLRKRGRPEQTRQLEREGSVRTVNDRCVAVRFVGLTGSAGPRRAISGGAGGPSYTDGQSVTPAANPTDDSQSKQCSEHGPARWQSSISTFGLP